MVKQCVWLYFHFALSYRNIDEMMDKRGVPMEVLCQGRRPLPYNRCFYWLLSSRSPSGVVGRLLMWRATFWSRPKRFEVSKGSNGFDFEFLSFLIDLKLASGKQYACALALFIVQV